MDAPGVNGPPVLELLVKRPAGSKMSQWASHSSLAEYTEGCFAKDRPLNQAGIE
jgi:hypothetical protein